MSLSTMETTLLPFLHCCAACLSAARLCLFCVVGQNNVYLGLDVKYTICLSGFTPIWLLSTAFRKNHISDFTNIRPLGGERIRAGERAGGRTDGRSETETTKVTDALREYANSHKDWDVKGSVRVISCCSGNWDGIRDC